VVILTVFSREADKLSKTGRQTGIPNKEIAIVGYKIGRRKFDGQEVVSGNLQCRKIGK